MSFSSLDVLNAPFFALFCSLLIGLIYWPVRLFLPSWRRSMPRVAVVLGGTLSGVLIAGVAASGGATGDMGSIVGIASPLIMIAVIQWMFKEGTTLTRYVVSTGDESVNGGAENGTLGREQERPIPKKKIFVSYRRADSAHAVDRICVTLRQHFGRDEIERDLDSIPKGADFRQYIEESLQRCGVLLAVIGDRWVGRLDTEGQSRLASDEDTVRAELESSKKYGVAIIPVLLDGTVMPSEDELPTSLSWLPYRNAANLRAGRGFDSDMRDLVESVEAVVGRPRKWWDPR